MGCLNFRFDPNLNLGLEATHTDWSYLGSHTLLVNVDYCWAILSIFCLFFGGMIFQETAIDLDIYSDFLLRKCTVSLEQVQALK